MLARRTVRKPEKGADSRRASPHVWSVERATAGTREQREVGKRQQRLRSAKLIWSFSAEQTISYPSGESIASDPMSTPRIALHSGDLPSGLSFGPAVAVDTETLGLRPHRDRLCLVQLSAGTGEAHIVQFDRGSYSAPNLKALLENSNILKIFHYARFDVAVLQAYLKANVGPIWCTKIASKLARTYTDRHGLKDLCAELLGLELSKQQQSSDWAAATLSPQQLAYAAADVLHLHEIKRRLEAMLVRDGRLDLAEACFRFLPVRARLDLAGFEDSDIFSH